MSKNTTKAFPTFQRAVRISHRPAKRKTRMLRQTALIPIKIMTYMPVMVAATMAVMVIIMAATMSSMANRQKVVTNC